jgi:uncharacterized membrane protein
LRGQRVPSKDAVLVPVLLLLVGWDLVVHDPSRALAWRLVHDALLEPLSAGASFLFPAMPEGLDRDPVALLLAGLASLLACVYLGAVLWDAGPRVRGFILVAATVALVLVPTAAFVAIGFAADRPFGQDGGVVQLPLALDRILAGASPYGADYSHSVLGRQSRVSEFWAPLGGNPILRHHAYLPGTHLLTMPFYLACRSLFGVFDPRIVTGLAFLLAAFLATRLVEGADAKLAAAALVTLNPLVYWHQVFGANDILFVALLLGAVHLARSERPTAAGALLGLACATKQLAWPFAPFLLAQLSGAASLRGLARRDSLRRLAAPLAAAALVFVLVVAPVAALDPGKFYRDIVGYNVGLPGGDNYPLGGTPGFGFANFVLYFGAVSSLKDAFPFTVFYLLLVPFGVLLLREQLRDGTAAGSLVTGSAALLASLYFSRVVHPNYLVGAAILLPLGVLATRRSASVAVAPLLLLWLAAVTVERGFFRAVWEQAAAAGLPARATGLLAALLPRGGPELTLDPLGLLFSAMAAGLGVLSLALAVLRAPARWRGVLLVVALLACVALPAGVVIGIGERTGLKRAQDAWAVQVPADAARLARGESPHREPSRAPTGREAWSDSFRQDPPRFLAPDSPLVPPGTALFGALLRPLRLDDGRLLSLVALGLAAALLLGAPGSERSLALSLLLAAPLVVGIVFGSPVPTSLSLLLAAILLARRGRALAAGLLAGAACACAHAVCLAAPFAMLPVLAAGRARRALVGLASGYAALVLPVAALDPTAYLGRAMSPASAGPGVGLVNLLSWRGLEEGVPAQVLLALLPLAVAIAWLAALVRARDGRQSPALLAGAFALVGLIASRQASPACLAIPVVLIALSGVLPDPETAS